MSAPQRLVRERYRWLWDITIDGRISRASHAVNTTRDQHETWFNRAYSFWQEDRQRAVFDEVWSTRLPKHGRLLALASDPRDLAHAHRPLPGSPCPLCGFLTFDWAEVPTLKESTHAALHAQVPHWAPDQGVCKRCAEVYEVAAKFEPPTTVCL